MALEEVQHAIPKPSGWIVFTISYLDHEAVKQTAVFEVSKQAAESVKAVLDAKGIHTCVEYGPCNMKQVSSPAM